MEQQPQVNLEHVVNILRIRLSDEIYHRALLEAAYSQQKEQLDQATKELTQLREQAANQHTQLSQQLETTKPENKSRWAEWSSPVPDTWASPQQTDTTTTTPANNPETAATPADTSQTPNDTK